MAKRILKEFSTDIDNLDDLTCNIDMDEDPEWSNNFLNEYFNDTPSTLLMGTTPTQPRTLQEHNIPVDKFAIADRLSLYTLEVMLSELGDFTLRTLAVIEVEDEQSGGGNETSLATITLPDFLSQTLPCTISMFIQPFSWIHLIL
jgi:hypothetical protein